MQFVFIVYTNYVGSLFCTANIITIYLWSQVLIQIRFVSRDLQYMHCTGCILHTLAIALKFKIPHFWFLVSF